MQQLKQFSQVMSDEIGRPLHPKMIRRVLRRNGFVWKRLRKSLRGERDPVLFEFFQKELEQLKQMALEEEIALYYLDETGLNLNPHAPYGWQLRGSTSELPAQRGESKTIIGYFSPIKQHLEAVIFEGAADALCVIEVINQLANQIERKTILVLDQATIHTAAIVKRNIPRWKQKGLYLQFLPAHSPELNLIEILWKHLKHFWLKLQDYQSLDTLSAAAAGILKNYGKHYAISFE
ncbi:MAG: IS630 family transposase [Bacteroidota bacterium]